VEAFARHGYDIPFDAVRPLIGMGGDNLVPALLHIDGKGSEARRLGKSATQLFKSNYLETVHPFPVAYHLVQEAKLSGLLVAVASSADEDILQNLLELIGIKYLLDATVSK